MVDDYNYPLDTPVNCNPTNFGSPMPFIGTYVAAASLACNLAMAADAFLGFRHKKLWFPCKFFTLNAATLTLLAIAMKLPMDLSNDMPNYWDQMAKLSGDVFMCTVIGNSMPSIGPMDNKELFMNIAALAILVVTIVVNVCIQIRNGVIPTLWTQHFVVMYLMLVLLLLLSFTALTVPKTKKYLDLKYEEVKKTASDQESEEMGCFTIEKLKEDIRKHWMMAKTGNPQFVIARSVISSASGGICFFAALILAEAGLQLFVAPFEYVDNSGDSDYKWSTIMIVVIQSLGVGIGTIAPVCRWLYSTKFRCSELKEGKNSEEKFRVEGYWIQTLVEWKDRPLALPIRGKKFRKFVHSTKKRFLDFCIKVQIVIVVVSKFVQLLLIFFTKRVLTCCQCCKGFRKKPKSNNDSESGFKLDLGCYVLHLEGEEGLPQQMVKNNSDATDGLIRMGKTQQPKYLPELLKKSTGIKGVAAFDSDKVPSLNPEEPPNCWALPVVTLTTIAISLPNIDTHMAKQLLSSVREGLSYVALVEKNLHSGGNLVNIRNAADTLWLEVDSFCRWLDLDLRKMVPEGKTSKENLERLANIAENIVNESKASKNMEQNPLNWPKKVIAANSMYRISKTVLLDLESSNDGQTDTDKSLFEQLSVMIADILSACLTNLLRVITMKCFCSTIEKREESVAHAARLLGETEEILKMLQGRELSGLGPDQAAYIEEWRALIKQRNLFISSSNNDAAPSDSAESHMTIE